MIINIIQYIVFTNDDVSVYCDVKLEQLLLY